MSSSAPNHRHAWDLIPWIVNGTADPQERAVVEAHVQGCAECRDELSFQRSVRAAVLAQPPVDAEDGWQRLRARLDREASVEEIVDEHSPIPALPPARARVGVGVGVRGWIWGRGWVAAAVLEAVLIGALGTALWSHARTPSAPTATGLTAPYRTLSAPDAVPAAATIRLVLEPSTTLAQLQALLQRSGLQIVAGPSTAGVWSLAPSRVSDRTATQAALRDLRADPVVRFAEPLDISP
jgi:hypothetical protein